MPNILSSSLCCLSTLTIAGCGGGSYVMHRNGIFKRNYIETGNTEQCSSIHHEENVPHLNRCQPPFPLQETLKNIIDSLEKLEQEKEITLNNLLIFIQELEQLFTLKEDHIVEAVKEMTKVVKKISDAEGNKQKIEIIELALQKTAVLCGAIHTIYNAPETNNIVEYWKNIPERYYIGISETEPINQQAIRMVCYYTKVNLTNLHRRLQGGKKAKRSAMRCAIL